MSSDNEDEGECDFWRDTVDQTRGMTYEMKATLLNEVYLGAVGGCLQKQSLQKQNDELREEYDRLRKENDRLRKENDRLRTKNLHLDMCAKTMGVPTLRADSDQAFLEESAEWASKVSKTPISTRGNGIRAGLAVAAVACGSANEMEVEEEDKGCLDDLFARIAKEHEKVRAQMKALDEQEKLEGKPRARRSRKSRRSHSTACAAQPQEAAEIHELNDGNGKEHADSSPPTKRARMATGNP